MKNTRTMSRQLRIRSSVAFTTLIALFLFLSVNILPMLSQTMMPLPPHASNYSGMIRGYYFISPTNFTIVGLRVPTDQGTANQSIQIVRFTAGPPPAFPGLTSSFVTLGYWWNVPGTNQIPCHIPVQTGDVIGIYGYRGQINSYGTGPWSTNIAGLPVTLHRSGHQGNIDAGTPAPDFWYEASSISRVEMWYIIVTAPNDAGIASIDSPKDFCPGTHDVKVTLKNFGINRITSATIKWTLNGVPQPDYLWTGMLDTLNQTTRQTSVTLGSRTFVANTNYTIRAWTAMPNGVPDTVYNNDTCQVTRKASISGTYTIGGASPNYPTFAAAVADLNAYGVCGPVVFNVRSGTYTEQVSLNEIPGASAVNTITFQSETGNRTDVTLTYSSASSTDLYTLRLNGADYVTFRNMTIAATGATYAQALVVTSGATYNKFTNNVLRSISTTSTSTNYAVVFSTSGTLDHYNEFRNNQMENGSYGMYYYGGSSTSFEMGSIIENNRILNPYYMGLYFYGQDGIHVLGNTININNTGTNYGIYMYYCPNQIRVEKNKITLNGTSGTKYGLVPGYCTAVAGLDGLVTNNFIMINGGTGTVYGLYPTYSNNTKFYHNTVYISSTGTSSRAMWSNYGTNYRIRNNIFYNAGTGYSYYNADGTTPNANVVESNYNVLYTGGTNLAYWNGANRTNLAALQSVSLKDLNSKSKIVTFADAPNGDLHLAGASLNDAELTGQLLPEVTTDIDNDPRVLPYIGADEGCYILAGTVKYDLVDGGGNPLAYAQIPGTMYINYTVAFPTSAANIGITLKFYTVPGNTLAYTYTFNVSKAAGVPLNGTSPVQVPPTLATGFYRITVTFNTKNSCEFYIDYPVGESAFLLVPVGSTPCVVWPGDVNNDGIVNYADRTALNKYILNANLSPLWLNGPARYRTDAATNPMTYYTWVGQASAPWNTPEGCYMDADGNGMVNTFDNLPIKINWMRTQPGWTPKSDESFAPTTFDMSQNYPNPFNPSTTIRYSVPEKSMVRLVVMDMLGREVSTLVDGEVEIGVRTVVFDASTLHSGSYIATVTMVGLESGQTFTKTIRMTLNK